MQTPHSRDNEEPPPLPAKGEREPTTLLRRWQERLKPFHNVIGFVVTGLIGATLFTLTHPSDETNGGPVTVADTQQLASWTQQHDAARINEVAFSSPPQTIYDVAQFLVEDGSANALDLLKQLCVRSDGATVVAQVAEDLPKNTALKLCSELIQNPDATVRQGALCTLFFIAASGNDFRGPWPVGMARPSARQESLRAEWEQERAKGLPESFEQWLYKDSVTEFLCGESPVSSLGAKGESALIAQVEAELRKQFGDSVKLRVPGS